MCVCVYNINAHRRCLWVVILEIKIDNGFYNTFAVCLIFSNLFTACIVEHYNSAAAWLVLFYEIIIYGAVVVRCVFFVAFVRCYSLNSQKSAAVSAKVVYAPNAGCWCCCIVNELFYCYKFALTQLVVCWRVEILYISASCFIIGRVGDNLGLFCSFLRVAPSFY